MSISDEHNELTVVENPDADDVGELVRSLVEFNDEAVGPEEYRKLGAFIRDSDRLVAGVSGHIHFRWLFVSHLWVAENVRGTGMGGRLLDAMERAAVERGCSFAWLDTFSLQAPDFYRRRGYEEFGRLDDYPPGFMHHYFWKRLHDLHDS